MILVLHDWLWKEGMYVKLAICFHNSNTNYFQLCSL